MPNPHPPREICDPCSIGAKDLRGQAISLTLVYLPTRSTGCNALQNPRVSIALEGVNNDSQTMSEEYNTLDTCPLNHRIAMIGSELGVNLHMHLVHGAGEGTGLREARWQQRLPMAERGEFL